MKIVLLTTSTTHHLYYAAKLHQTFQLHSIFLETKGLTAPFNTEHSFEEERDLYESQILSEEQLPEDFSSITEAVKFDSFNNPEALDELKQINPDAVIVFGAGKLTRDLIKICEGKILNLHGGDPEEYRGLDTHMWAIYHSDYDGLITTIHHLNPKLDDGDIILREAVQISPGMKLHQLRLANTDTCLRLSIGALLMISKNGKIVSLPQRKKGRYYSFMPSDLKEVCLRKFEKHTARLV